MTEITIVRKTKLELRFSEALGNFTFYEPVILEYLYKSFVQENLLNISSDVSPLEIVDFLTVLAFRTSRTVYKKEHKEDRTKDYAYSAILQVRHALLTLMKECKSSEDNSDTRTDTSYLAKRIYSILRETVDTELLFSDIKLSRFEPKEII